MFRLFAVISLLTMLPACASLEKPYIPCPAEIGSRQWSTYMSGSGTAHLERR